MPTTKVGRARQCYGTPPRQIEDLSAPACLATIFEGDNGGVTARGVSGTEIRVGVPVGSGFATSSSASTKARRDTLSSLFEYFNQRFELYGRRLVPVLVEGSTSDALTSRALGAQVGAASVFGAITGPIELTGFNPQASLPQELARNEVVTVAQNRVTWWSDRVLFDPLHPYLWSVYPSAEAQQANLAGIGCALAGKTARHTPDPDIVGKPRHFGVLTLGTQNPPGASTLSGQLEACTGKAPARFSWTSASGAGANGLRTGMQQFMDQGVTTVICVCEYVWFGDAMTAGRALQFDPEWVITTSNYSGGEEYVGQAVSQFWKQWAVQVQAGPRVDAVQAASWFPALLATNPALLANGAALPDVFSMAEFAYDQLLVLASGIQAAGPNLTADSFAAGLMAAQFPNPGAGQAPGWQPRVGFGPGDHSFYDGFAIAWWSDSAPRLSPTGYGTGQGSWCYVGTGGRYDPDMVPTDLDGLLFNAGLPCR